jgi:uncharacterized glyoxalase superfamily protein PhnB
MSSQLRPAIVPFISYQDGAAAIDFLVRGFGFTEEQRITDEDGRIGHATLSLGEGLVYLTEMGEAYEAPRKHAENCARARRWLDTPYVVDGVFVLVEDVRAHYERAKAAGAGMLSEVEDGGVGLLYRTTDPEGHRWMFCQR